MDWFISNLGAMGGKGSKYRVVNNKTYYMLYSHMKDEVHDVGSRDSRKRILSLGAGEPRPPQQLAALTAAPSLKAHLGAKSPQQP